MDLIVSTLLYGAAAVALLFLALFSIGLIAGLTSFWRSWRMETNHTQHSQSSWVTRHESFPESESDVTATRLVYPSRKFDKATTRLIESAAPFVVVVPATSRKRAVVERELLSMTFLVCPQESVARGFIEKLRTIGLWACVAAANVDEKYNISYIVRDDIEIRFAPVRRERGKVTRSYVA